MGSNEKSGFQARELKSVYVDTHSLLLKIVLHKCHLNKFNLYSQIGMIAMNFMGEMGNNATDAPSVEEQPTFEE